MDNEIPNWAGERACELLNAEASELGQYSRWDWPRDDDFVVTRAVAKLVMQHETPPADPDEEAVKRVLWAYYDHEVGLDYDDLARAVSQYKQEKANG